MDTLNELYILGSAIFIACWFSKRVPVWMKRAYNKSVANHGYSSNNAIQYLYEIFCGEGA